MILVAVSIGRIAGLKTDAREAGRLHGLVENGSSRNKQFTCRTGRGKGNFLDIPF